MITARRVKVLGPFATVALVVAACSGANSGTGDDEASAVSINSCEPDAPLIPTSVTGPCTGNPLDQIFTGLVGYNPGTAEPENAVASDISSEDNITWRITLNDDWTFHDGTDVTAESFVRAWNWGAYGPNVQPSSYFFEPIKGFADVQGNDANGDKEITPDEAPATEMSGLTVVSDTEFTVELSAPSSVFPVMLGFIAFAPLPDSFFEDPEAFGKAPVGNGPFQYVSYARGESIKLTAFDDFPGTKPEVEDVEYRFYTDLDAAYADLITNNLDIVWRLPASALTDDAYLDDLGERVVDQANGSMAYLTAPLYLPAYANPDLAKAISMAINREQVIDVAFNGSRLPATGWVSPVVNGYKAGACGEYCDYQPAAAKTLFQTTGFAGPITITYEADGGHKTWVDAVCTSISNTLGVDCQGSPSPDYAAFREGVTAHEYTGLIKSAWLMDYPSIENYLVPQYSTHGYANDAAYSNPAFDAAVAEAATLTGSDAIARYQQAEAMLADDFPVIPLWYGRTIAGYSENITEVRFTPFESPDLTSVRLS
jgi:oligopeptide transport system substrate-binding protein